MYFWRHRRDFFSFYVTKPVNSVNSRDWTGLLTQRIDPDHFILWHPSVIARVESTIAGTELSIGGPRATPKVYKLTPMAASMAVSSLYVTVYLPLFYFSVCTV